MTGYDPSVAPPLPNGISPFSSDFHFARPSTDEAVEALFDQLVPKLAATAKMQADLRALDIEKKWIMVYNDALSKWKAARDKITQKYVDSRMPAAASTSGDGGKATVGRKSWGKNESPEWYIGKFMDGSVTPAQVASLSVCLRTYELE